LDTLHAISPLDGRYSPSTAPISLYASEAALITYRLRVEAHWLDYLAKKEEIYPGTLLSLIPAEHRNPIVTFLQEVQQGNIAKEATARIKALEQTTQHDVKAVEYYLKERLQAYKAPEHFLAFIHFAATSEDINNLAYGLMLKDLRCHIILPKLHTLIKNVRSMAHTYASSAMVGRTHGQVASPTTMGKELSVFVSRLQRQYHLLQQQAITGKMAGATGNYNAHLIAYPSVPWQDWGKEFVTSLGLQHNPTVTQIENHDTLAEYLDTLRRINSICLDLARDMWGYISLGYFSQHVQPNEVGSSTMPHKINPIDFENAEGNLGLASSLCVHLSEKLLISRYQRDLSDSTVLRSLGSCVSYHSLAIQGLLKGLSKVALNQEVLDNDLHKAHEVLAEAIQTLLRKHGIHDGYEKLKEKTRGKPISSQTMQQISKDLSSLLPESAHEDRKRLLSLTPHTYIGSAADIASNI